MNFPKNKKLHIQHILLVKWKWFKSFFFHFTFAFGKFLWFQWCIQELHLVSCSCRLESPWQMPKNLGQVETEHSFKNWMWRNIFLSTSQKISFFPFCSCSFLHIGSIVSKNVKMAFSTVEGMHSHLFTHCFCIVWNEKCWIKFWQCWEFCTARGTKITWKLFKLHAAWWLQEMSQNSKI